MRQHAAKDLKYSVDLLAPDGETVVLSGAGACIEDLTGKRLEQAQVVGAETTHLITLRYLDSLALPVMGHIQVEDPNTGVVTLYIVDAPPLDPRVPRPRVWAEVYCHVERAGN